MKSIDCGHDGPVHVHHLQCASQLGVAHEEVGVCVCVGGGGGHP